MKNMTIKYFPRIELGTDWDCDYFLVNNRLEGEHVDYREDFVEY